MSIHQLYNLTPRNEKLQCAETKNVLAACAVRQIEIYELSCAVSKLKREECRLIKA
jgi:hypothetical protein